MKTDLSALRESDGTSRLWSIVALMGSIAITAASAQVVAQPSPSGYITRSWSRPVYTTGIDDLSSSKQTLDYRHFFGEQGIEIPDDGTALFDSRRGTLTCSAPEPIIEQIDRLLGEDEAISLMCECEFTIVEMTLPTKVPMDGNQSYRLLREAAGTSWKVMHRSMINCGPYGQTVAELIRQQEPRKSGKLAKRKAGERRLAPDETGVRVIVLPAIDPDTPLIRLDLQYEYESDSRDHDKIEGLFANLGWISARDGAATVVNLKRTSGNRAQALIVRVTVVDDNGRRGWRKREASLRSW